ncbi:hypothetical protein V2G26_001471 [Clonostachys chloroleuca]
MMQPERRKSRRTANACIACRQSKIKCSGDEPCSNCKRRLIPCRFTDGGNKVVVSEKYLQELRKQAQDHRQGQPYHQPFSPGQPSPVSQAESLSRPSNDTSFGSILESHITPLEAIQVDVSPETTTHDQLEIFTNPFALPSTIIKNTHKNRRHWIWLAPSSTWSFNVRLSVAMTDKLQFRLENSPPSALGADVYPLKWRSLPDDVLPDISGIPSIDRALYLFNTVKFHIGHHYQFIDDQTFLQNLNEFYYGNAQEKALELRLWFVQFLIVLAFGSAFLSRAKNRNEPPGAGYFVRAMELLPDLGSLWKDSLLAVEVLALAGLYLYSIGHRESANVYLGQALRIAQLEGLHTRLPESELGHETVERCRRLWWTLYIMDRHFSTSLGIPMSTTDSDISALINSSTTGSQEDTILNLQVKLSHLTSVILRTIYATDKTELGAFLEKTKSILHTLAGHAQEIEEIIHAKFHNSVAAMSQGTRHITLLYHQCVILATRPLLLSVLKERLEKLGRADEDWQGFFELTTRLITTSIKSATKTIQILSEDDNQTDVFLPFDLEFIYGAALHMVMASSLFPGVTDGQGYVQQVHSIFDDMIGKGNKLAQGHRAELAHLETLFQELARQSEQQGLETLTLRAPDGSEYDNFGSQHASLGPEIDPALVMASVPPTIGIPLSIGGDMPPSPTSGTTQPLTNMEFLDNIGISSFDFFDIVDQLGQPEMENSDILDPQLM